LQVLKVKYRDNFLARARDGYLMVPIRNSVQRIESCLKSGVVKRPSGACTPYCCAISKGILAERQETKRSRAGKAMEVRIQFMMSPRRYAFSFEFDLGAYDG